MSLPFEKEKEDWKPRNHIGRDDSLTALERQILDTVDILEQRQDRTSRIAIFAYNAVLIEGAALVYVIGPDLLKLLRGWIGGGP